MVSNKTTNVGAVSDLSPLIKLENYFKVYDMIKNKKRELLLEFVDNKCEQCRKKGKLEIHRINHDMDYTNFRNLKVLCKKCHDIYSSAQRNAYGIS